MADQQWNPYRAGRPLSGTGNPNTGVWQRTWEDGDAPRKPFGGPLADGGNPFGGGNPWKRERSGLSKGLSNGKKKKDGEEAQNSTLPPPNTGSGAETKALNQAPNQQALNQAPNQQALNSGPRGLNEGPRGLNEGPRGLNSGQRAIGRRPDPIQAYLGRRLEGQLGQGTRELGQGTRELGQGKTSAIEVYSTKNRKNNVQ